MLKDLLEKLGAVGLDDLRKAVGEVKKTADQSDVLADDKLEMLMRSFADEALDVVSDREGIKVTD